MSRFADVGDKINVPAEEEAILKHWQAINAFETSLELSKDRPEFTFYDGPPFATGLSCELALSIYLTTIFIG